MLNVTMIFIKSACGFSIALLFVLEHVDQTMTMNVEVFVKLL
jgi:hypothetical protein